MEMMLNASDFKKVLNILYDVFAYHPRRPEAELLVEQRQILRLLRPNTAIYLRFQRYLQENAMGLDPSIIDLPAMQADSTAFPQVEYPQQLTDDTLEALTDNVTPTDRGNNVTIQGLLDFFAMLGYKLHFPTVAS